MYQSTFSLFVVYVHGWHRAHAYTSISVAFLPRCQMKINFTGNITPVLIVKDIKFDVLLVMNECICSSTS